MVGEQSTGIYWNHSVLARKHHRFPSLWIAKINGNEEPHVPILENAPPYFPL
jgi:hypothetical protein